MKLYNFLIAFFLSSTLLFAENIIYQHPLANTRLHSPSTTIIIRFNPTLHIQATQVQFTVTGQVSGAHTGEIIQATDNKTIIFKPDAVFESGEKVSVKINVAEKFIVEQFSFTISGDAMEFLAAEEENVQAPIPSTGIRFINGVPVPSDFPEYKIIQNGPTAEGFLFVHSDAYWMILQNDGTPVYYRKRNGGSNLWDFTVQNDSTISIMEGATAKTFNKNYEPVNTYKGGNGYKTDHHEFQLTPEGHALLNMEDIQKINMSKIIAGGNPNAYIVGNHFQELDTDKNVIFEWRCWDHYTINDALHENLTNTTIHMVHLNSIAIDYDGNYIISARHLDEVTKIDRNTGAIIWRLGGRNNQFQFANESDKFTYQHDVRPVPGKPNHYTMFDNGNFHVPVYSRAIEYVVNTQDMTVKKEWEYRKTPDLYSHWMGNVQRLPNGNTGICWSELQLPKYTEVSAAGDIQFEFDFVKDFTVYRAHRFNWQGTAKSPYLMAEATIQAITLIFNQFGEKDIDHYNVYADTLANPTSKIAQTTEPFIIINKLINYKTWYFRVTSVNSQGKESEFSNEVDLYVRIISPDDNQIRNGDFTNNLASWQTEDTNSETEWVVNEDGQLEINIQSTLGHTMDVELSQSQLVLQTNKTYKLEFEAYADHSHAIEVVVMNDPGRKDYSQWGMQYIDTRQRTYTLEFTMLNASDYASRIFFGFGATTGKVFLDNVRLTQLEDTHVEEPDKKLPQLQLYANYPNPFNGSTTISYELPAVCDVEISIYNILGEEIFNKSQHQQAAGLHQIHVDAAAWSSGVYFYEIQAIEPSTKLLHSSRQKMLLVK